MHKNAFCKGITSLMFMMPRSVFTFHDMQYRNIRSNHNAFEIRKSDQKQICGNWKTELRAGLVAEKQNWACVGQTKHDRHLQAMDIPRHLPIWALFDPFQLVPKVFVWAPKVSVWAPYLFPPVWALILKIFPFCTSPRFSVTLCLSRRSAGSHKLATEGLPEGLKICRSNPQ